MFGVNLDFLLKREHGSEEIPPDTIPMILDRCLAEVERRGLQEVGICESLVVVSTALISYAHRSFSGSEFGDQFFKGGI